MIILGIDPGLANTGWGIIECEADRCRAVAYGCVTTRPSESVPARLSIIHAEIVSAIERYRPTECGIESVYFSNNAKSAFATGQARGVALLATAQRALSIGEYSPVQVKSVVAGVGSADKDQVAFMVRRWLELDHDVRPDHASDALALALTHSRLAAHDSLRAVRT